MSKPKPLASQVAAVAANASLTKMHRRIGQRLGIEVLAGQRARYGAQSGQILHSQWPQTFRSVAPEVSP